MKFELRHGRRAAGVAVRDERRSRETRAEWIHGKARAEQRRDGARQETHGAGGAGRRGGFHRARGPLWRATARRGAAAPGVAGRRRGCRAARLAPVLSGRRDLSGRVGRVHVALPDPHQRLRGRAAASHEPGRAARAARAAGSARALPGPAPRARPRAPRCPRDPGPALRRRALVRRAREDPRHLDQYREEPARARQEPAAHRAHQGRTVMKTVLTDDMLKGYFQPDAEPGDLARRVLLAARASARESGKLLDRLAIQATAEGISLIRAERLEKPATAGARRLVERAREELYEYFQGKRAFFSVPLDLSETPDFQRRVLEAARRLPFRQVRAL